MGQQRADNNPETGEKILLRQPEKLELFSSGSGSKLDPTPRFPAAGGKPTDSMPIPKPRLSSPAAGASGCRR
jgi:hypothetical protein